MLQELWNLPRSIRLPRRRTEADRANADDIRLNPWLLWRPSGPAGSTVLSVAELAECTCPDLCDRDHANE